MTVEDHPLYEEWAAALDHLVEARERFNAAVDEVAGYFRHWQG